MDILFSFLLSLLISTHRHDQFYKYKRTANCIDMPSIRSKNHMYGGNGITKLIKKVKTHLITHT